MIAGECEGPATKARRGCARAVGLQWRRRHAASPRPCPRPRRGPRNSSGCVLLRGIRAALGGVVADRNHVVEMPTAETIERLRMLSVHLEVEERPGSTAGQRVDVRPRPGAGALDVENALADVAQNRLRHLRASRVACAEDQHAKASAHGVPSTLLRRAAARIATRGGFHGTNERAHELALDLGRHGVDVDASTAEKCRASSTL